MSGIRVLDVGISWHDGAANDPDLCFLVDRKPEWSVYDKRPCARETTSDQQTGIIGGRYRERQEGWHLYWAEDDGFAWFFTWGGKPDNGFGRWRRTITLLDGSTEEIVGGWHVSAQAAADVGHPPGVDCSYRTDYLEIRGERRLAGGTGCFVTEERFQREIDAHRPECEVIRGRTGLLTVKWRGRPSKAEFMRSEQERADKIRDRLRAKYTDTWPGDWYRRASAEERAGLQCAPYSALGQLVDTHA